MTKFAEGNAATHPNTAPHMRADVAVYDAELIDFTGGSYIHRRDQRSRSTVPFHELFELPPIIFRFVVSGALVLRGLDHAIRLVTGRPSRGMPEHTGDAAMVDDLARRWRLVSENAGSDSVLLRLREVQQSVRSVYRRVVASE